jgi:hypothetical protein
MSNIEAKAFELYVSAYKPSPLVSTGLSVGAKAVAMGVL